MTDQHHCWSWVTITRLQSHYCIAVRVRLVNITVNVGLLCLVAQRLLRSTRIYHKYHTLYSACHTQRPELNKGVLAARQINKPFIWLQLSQWLFVWPQWYSISSPFLLLTIHICCWGVLWAVAGALCIGPGSTRSYNVQHNMSCHSGLTERQYQHQHYNIKCTEERETDWLID